MGFYDPCSMGSPFAQAETTLETCSDGSKNITPSGFSILSYMLTFLLPLLPKIEDVSYSSSTTVYLLGQYLFSFLCTVFPRIVSALEQFPPLNSFRTCMYCEQRSYYIRLNSKKNSFRRNYLRKYGIGSFFSHFAPLITILAPKIMEQQNNLL